MDNFGHKHYLLTQRTLVDLKNSLTHIEVTEDQHKFLRDTMLYSYSSFMQCNIEMEQLDKLLHI